MPNYIFKHKHVDDGYIVEMRIIKVKQDKYYPEGVRYSLVVIDRKTKKRILGFDNHERKGHHMHKFSRELSYEFKNEWELIEDFMKEYENIKRRKNEN